MLHHLWITAHFPPPHKTGLNSVFVKLILLYLFVMYLFLCVCQHVCMHCGYTCDMAQVEVNGQRLAVSSLLLPSGCWELNSACRTWGKCLSSLSPTTGSQLGFKNYRKRKCFTYCSQARKDRKIYRQNQPTQRADVSFNAWGVKLWIVELASESHKEPSDL